MIEDKKRVNNTSFKLTAANSPDRIGIWAFKKLEEDAAVDFLGSPAEIENLRKKNEKLKDIRKKGSVSKSHFQTPPQTPEKLFQDSNRSNSSSTEKTLGSRRNKLTWIKQQLNKKGIYGSDDGSISSKSTVSGRTVSEKTVETLNKSALKRAENTTFQQSPIRTVGTRTRHPMSKNATQNKAASEQRKSEIVRKNEILEKMLNYLNDIDNNGKIDDAILQEFNSLYYLNQDNASQNSSITSQSSHSIRFGENSSVSVGRGTAGFNGSMNNSSILKPGNRSQASVPPDNLKGSGVTPSKGRCFDEKEGRPSLASQASMQHQLNLPGNKRIPSSTTAATIDSYASVYSTVHGGSMTPSRR